jgi:hypothetical protein
MIGCRRCGRFAAGEVHLLGTVGPAWRGGTAPLPMLRYCTPDGPRSEPVPEPPPLAGVWAWTDRGYLPAAVVEG